MSTPVAIVSSRGERRWADGHPWIYRSDVRQPPDAQAGAVLVRGARGAPAGWALWSPLSEISLRRLTRSAGEVPDATWWRERIAESVARRASLAGETTACRLIHGEGDGLPSLVCDRYDRWLVVQLMSAGLEAFRAPIVDALMETTGADGLLARNESPLRAKEGLPRETGVLSGDVPREIEIVEHGVRYLAAPWTGQKTGAFLDQREARRRAGVIAHGKALDCFSYHGSFALHLARGAEQVTALDTSAEALDRAQANFALNGITNVECVSANAFDYLRARDEAGDRFDTIVLDPPAFAKTKSALPGALRGYHEINRRALRLLNPGGMLLTASCSFHLTRPLFLEMLEGAAADSGRRVALRELLGQPIDHPEILTIPETGYIKGAIVEVLDPST